MYVKILVFWELIVWVFEINCSGFFLCVVVGGPLGVGVSGGSRGVGAPMVWAGRVEKGGAPRGPKLRKNVSQKGGARRVGTRRVGAPKGGGNEGWGARNFALFSLSRRKIRSFLPCLGVLSWNFGVF